MDLRIRVYSLVDRIYLYDIILMTRSGSIRCPGHFLYTKAQRSTRTTGLLLLLFLLISYFYSLFRSGHKLLQLINCVTIGIHEIRKGCKLGCTFGFLPLCIHIFRNHLANNFSCFRISMHREVIFSKNSFHPQILFRMLLMYKWLTCNPGCLGRYCKYTAL